MSPLIVPGIMGYGTTLRGAYAGSPEPEIYRMTTLADTTSQGSFRHAFETAPPQGRCIIPEVGGYVDLQDTVRARNPFVNFYGQFAPSPGVHLRRYGMEVTGRQMLLQHFSIRPGEHGLMKYDNCGLIAFGNDCRDLVFDHMSIAWGPDECWATDSYYSGAQNITLSHCGAFEGLQCPKSVPDSASHGLLAMAESRMVTFDRCFSGTCLERNPYWQGNCRIVCVNLVNFNAQCVWHFLGSTFGLDGVLHSNNPWSAMVLGCVSVAGQATYSDRDSPYGVQFVYNINQTVQCPGCRMYREDNLIVNTYPNAFDEVLNQAGYQVDQPAPLAELPIAPFANRLKASQTEAYVYANVGARPLDRYPHDARVIESSRKRTATTGAAFVRHQSEVGDYTPLTPSSRKVSLPANPHAVTASGYTELELLAQDYANALQPGGGPPIPPDPPVTTASRSRVCLGGVVHTR